MDQPVCSFRSAWAVSCPTPELMLSSDTQRRLLGQAERVLESCSLGGWGFSENWLCDSVCLVSKALAPWELMATPQLKNGEKLGSRLGWAPCRTFCG